MKKLVLVTLVLLQSYVVFADDKCTAVLKKIEASYKERKDQAITNFLAKSINSNTIGTFSLTQVYTPIFNSPQTHMFTFSTEEKKITGVAHIKEINNICVLALGISDKESGFGHEISINAQGVLEVRVDKNDKYIILPSSTLVPITK